MIYIRRDKNKLARVDLLSVFFFTVGVYVRERMISAVYVLYLGNVVTVNIGFLAALNVEKARVVSDLENSVVYYKLIIIRNVIVDVHKISPENVN